MEVALCILNTIAIGRINSHLMFTMGAMKRMYCFLFKQIFYGTQK